MKANRKDDDVKVTVHDRPMKKIRSTLQDQIANQAFPDSTDGPKPNTVNCANCYVNQAALSI